MRSYSIMATLIVFLLFSPAATPAIKGEIKGKIVNAQTNPIAGVTVTIISVDYPSEQYKLMTNKKGEFIQIGLEPGSYRIRCEKETYQPQEEQVRVTINEIVEKNIILSAVAEPMKVEEIPGKKELREANKLFQEGKYDEALAAYQQAADQAPEDSIVQYNTGVAFMALGKVEEAIAAFKKTLEIQPENHQALKYLGQIYGGMKAFDESVKFYSRAAKISSIDPEVFYNLGVGHMNLGNLDAAQEAFQKSIACKENYADSYYLLGLIFLNQNKMAEALAALEKFLLLVPEDGKAGNVREMIKIIKEKQARS
ncbi:MAG: tetratricopeptide repeat protein [Planctomycetes bacterium]|nr:tetratricopeptide repeat protein [Planctomycetota bacterium]